MFLRAVPAGPPAGVAIAAAAVGAAAVELAWEYPVVGMAGRNVVAAAPTAAVAFVLKLDAAVAARVTITAAAVAAVLVVVVW